MSIVMDPAEKEIRALLKAVEWKGKRVLEIGCGEGRLTLRLAAFRPRHIEAIDPDQARVQLARKDRPAKYGRLISYHVGHAERLRYARNQFDIAIFAWSLWWVAPEGMVHALKEAHRVLKPNGTLIDLRPGPAHRRAGIGEGRRWRAVGAMHEVLDDDYAADAAIARMIREGYFRPEQRMRFQLDRVMDTSEDLREFIADFDERHDLPTHAPLVDRVEQQLARLTKPEKIVVRGPLKLGVLKKLEPALMAGWNGESMILAILPDASKAETLLNNLSEADFDISDVSVVMQDVDTRDKIAKDTGPLKGAKPAQLSAALKKAGASPASIQRGAEAVKGGKPLVAMKVDPKYEHAAREMFTDMSAEILE